MTRLSQKEEIFLQCLEEIYQANAERVATAAVNKALIQTGQISEIINFTEVKQNYAHSIAQRALKAPELNWKRKGTGSKTCGLFTNREKFTKYINTITQ